MFKKIIHAFLVLAISRELASITWLALEFQLWNPASGSFKTSQNSGWTAPIATRLPGGIEMLGQLFGESPQQKKNPFGLNPAQMESLPISPIKLLLVGILYHDDPSRSLAAFIDVFGQERVRKIGSMLPENAKLVAILQDRVLVLRNGIQEQLRLPDETQREILAKFRVKIDQQREVTRIWQTFAEKPDEVLRMIRMNPAERNGKLIGVQLDHGQDTGFLGRFGLQPGDIVTWLNGENLDSYEKGMKILRSLNTAQSMRFKVLRGEINLEFSYDKNSDITMGNTVSELMKSK